MGDLISYRCHPETQVYTFMVAPNRKITVKGADRAMQEVEIRLLRQAWEMDVAEDNVCEGSYRLMKKLRKRFEDPLEDREQQLRDTVVSWSYNTVFELVEVVCADGSVDQYSIMRFLGVDDVKWLEQFLVVVHDNYEPIEPFRNLENALNYRIQQLKIEEMNASSEEDESDDSDDSDYEDGFYKSEEVCDGDE